MYVLTTMKTRLNHNETLLFLQLMTKTNIVNHVKQENLIVHHISQIQVVKRAFFCCGDLIDFKGKGDCLINVLVIWSWGNHHGYLHEANTSSTWNQSYEEVCVYQDNKHSMH